LKKNEIRKRRSQLRGVREEGIQYVIGVVKIDTHIAIQGKHDCRRSLGVEVPLRLFERGEAQKKKKRAARGHPQRARSQKQ